MEKTNTKNQKNNTNFYKILCIILAVILLVVLGIMFRKWYNEEQAERKFNELAEMTTDDSGQEMEEDLTDTEPGTEEAVMEEEEPESWTQLGIDVPERNLDWEALWKENEDIYAWIYIPNTNVDYPILQHPTDDTHYLNYNLDGSKGYPGCIYTESLNHKNFLDYNTVIYGHNMRNQTMFRTLHNFEEDTFFAENPYIYIYTPDGILVYEIFAAYERDDAHVLNTNDFYSESGYQKYLDEVLGMRDMSAHIRSEVEVTSQNHIITLSTCVSGKSDRRYLVQAVLLNDPTQTNAE